MSDVKLLTILIATIAFGQTAEQSRTFTFAHAQTPQHIQEVVNTIRSIGDVQRLAVDPQARSMTVTGTPDQLTFTSWLMTELDKPASPAQAMTVRDSSIADPRAPAVKILYPAHLTGPQSVQELVNGIRAIAELQRVLPVQASGAIIARGSPEQVALAEWIVRQFDDPSRGVREQKFEGSAVRYYATSRLTTPQDLQETVNALRAISDTQRVMVFTGQRAIILRGTPEQVSLTDWMVKELDQAVPATAGHEVAFGDSTVRSVFLAKNADLPGTVARVRQVTGMQRVVGTQRQKAIVLRGTPGQLALAEGLLR